MNMVLLTRPMHRFQLHCSAHACRGVKVRADVISDVKEGRSLLLYGSLE